MDSVSNIREEFVRKLYRKEIVNGTIEIIGQSFIADHETIFGSINHDYVNREIDWYLSKSLKVADIPGGPPKIWQQIASNKGEINSNYGYLAMDIRNGDQLANVTSHLLEDPFSRRAVAIYTRPTMHEDWNRNGMADFVCTNAVQYLIRDGKLHLVVQMRSNDAIFGYRNDFAWQEFTQEVVRQTLSNNGVDVELGDIIWNAASLHIYERHFWLVEHFDKTGEFDVALR